MLRRAAAVADRLIIRRQGRVRRRVVGVDLQRALQPADAFLLGAGPQRDFTGARAQRGVVRLLLHLVSDDFLDLFQVFYHRVEPFPFVVGLRRLAEGVEALHQVVVRVARAGVAGHGLAQPTLGPVGLTVLQRQPAAGRQGFGEVRPTRQDAVQQLPRLVRLRHVHPALGHLNLDARVVRHGLMKILQVGKRLRRVVAPHQQDGQAPVGLLVVRIQVEDAAEILGGRFVAVAQGRRDGAQQQGLAIVRPQLQPFVHALQGLVQAVNADQARRLGLQNESGGRVVLPHAGVAELADLVHAAALRLQQHALQDQVLVVRAAHRLIAVKELLRLGEGPEPPRRAGRQQQGGRLVRPGAKVGFEVVVGGPVVVVVHVVAGGLQQEMAPQLHADHPHGDGDDGRQGEDGGGAAGTAD